MYMYMVHVYAYNNEAHCTDLPLLLLKAGQNVVPDDLGRVHLPDPKQLQCTVHSVRGFDYGTGVRVYFKHEWINHLYLIKQAFESGGGNWRKNKMNVHIHCTCI